MPESIIIYFSLDVDNDDDYDNGLKKVLKYISFLLEAG